MKIVIRIIIATLLIATSAVYADSQNLSLSVRQKGTGDPVEGATVVVMPSKGYVTTDVNGQAILDDITAGTQIKVLAAGYKTLETTVTPVKGVMKIYLEPILVEGAGMEVVAERLPDKVSKIALTAEELAHTPGTQGDPIMAAQTLPGVVAVNDGGVYARQRRQRQYHRREPGPHRLSVPLRRLAFDH